MGSPSVDFSQASVERRLRYRDKIHPYQAEITSCAFFTVYVWIVSLALQRVRKCKEHIETALGALEFSFPLVSLWFSISLILHRGDVPLVIVSRYCKTELTFLVWLCFGLVCFRCRSGDAVVPTNKEHKANEYEPNHLHHEEFPSRNFTHGRFVVIGVHNFLGSRAELSTSIDQKRSQGVLMTGSGSWRFIDEVPLLIEYTLPRHDVKRGMGFAAAWPW